MTTKSPVNRRAFLGAILAAGIAPAIVRASSIMPLWVPRDPSQFLLGIAEEGASTILTWPEATAIEIARDIRDLIWEEMTIDERVRAAIRPPRWFEAP